MSRPDLEPSGQFHVIRAKMSQELNRFSEQMLWAGTDPGGIARKSKGHLRRLYNNKQIWPGMGEKKNRNKSQNWPRETQPKEKSILHTPVRVFFYSLMLVFKDSHICIDFCGKRTGHAWSAMPCNRASHIDFTLFRRSLSHQLASLFLATITVISPVKMTYSDFICKNADLLFYGSCCSIIFI